ncbi:MAG TPA: tetratricopeptide repeat protein, partial [Archangium sp.]
KLGDHPRARATAEAIAAGAKDQGTAIQALLDAAKLARDVERNEQAAEDLFQKVLDREPLHAEAGPGLEDLLARKGGAVDLAKLHEKRGEAKLAQKDLAAAAKEFFEAASIHLDALKQRPQASAMLDRALMAMPTFPEALELKGMLALESQNYAEAAAALAVRVQQGGDPRALAKLNLKLGALYHDHLSDLTRAAAHLQTALSGDPASVEALERLAGIHTQSRNWTGAADCMRRLLELDPPLQTKAKHTLALARITDEGFGDIAQAIVLYRKALELIPGDALTLDRLATLYERTGSLAELATMLEQQAQHASDVKKVVALKLRIAALYARSLDDPPRAVATLRQVLELDATQVAAWVALAELYQRDSASTALAIEAHRNIVRLDPTRADSLHALFRMWESLRQLDKAFCAAALLVFLKQANETESAFYAEGRNRLSNELKGSLQPADVTTLHPPVARTAMVDVLRAVGDQFVKLYPPQFELQGIDKKADRLKNDHAVFKALQTVTNLFGIEEFEVYQAKRGLVFLETTEPLAVCLGPDVVRRFNIREQRFLFGRAAMGLFDKAAIVRKLATAELADVLGNSVRIHQQTYDGLGRKNEEQSKQLRRAYSRKSLRLLEEPANTAMGQGKVTLEPFVQALFAAADRAGLVVCADPTAGLNLILREEVLPNQSRVDTAEAIASAVNSRPDLKDLVTFAVTDDFFRLRQRVGVAL